jgi:hypothetical protein
MVSPRAGAAYVPPRSAGKPGAQVPPLSPRTIILGQDRQSFGASNMSIFKRETKQVEQLEGEIREFVWRDMAPSGTHSEDPKIAMDYISSLLQRVSANSVQEIDETITRLDMLRDRLRDEGARVQRLIEEYASLCQGATQSTKIIAESLNLWTKVPDAP